MSTEPTKRGPTSHHAERQKTLDREIKELISALNTCLGSIQRSQNPGGSSNHSQDEEDEEGVKIITLTGNNLGATMRANMDDKPVIGTQGLGLAQPEQEDPATYVNSNFQAINNSIMLGGSYKTNDPGVHLDISDYEEHSEENPKRGEKSGDGV
ncbi:hypothetical protein OROHE_003603 [Orobanche hederae]